MIAIDKRLTIALTLLALVSAACGGVRPTARQAVSGVVQEEAGFELPVYRVTGNAASPESGQALADSLGLPQSVWEADGALRFVDDDRFQHVPMIDLGSGEPNEDGETPALTAPDLEALAALPVLADETALTQAQSALEQAGLLPAADGVIQATAGAAHTTFDAYDTEGAALVSAQLDTEVYYDLALDGVPLVGPGAKIELVFDGDGAATFVLFALRGLERGESVAAIPPDQGAQLCRDAYGGEADDDAQIAAELVYFAPPLESGGVTRIVPHYRCSGTATVDAQEMNLLRRFVPAILETPQVTLAVSADGATVMGQTTVSGGVPPYSFAWSSHTTPLDETLASSAGEISYALASREAVDVEVLSVVVTDADGLEATASASVEISGETTILGAAPAVAGLARPATSPGRTDVGLEWTGFCNKYNLPGAGKSARHFARLMQRDGYAVQFNWGEKLAWERDFRDQSLGGTDHLWVDDVDYLLLQTHGQPLGFAFCVNKDTRPFYHSKARWGHIDLEWMGLDSCQVLKWSHPAGNLIVRWRDAFAGLHHLMGYDTDAYDSSNMGFLYAVLLTGNDPHGRGTFSRAYPVREAWALASKYGQPSEVVWVVVAPFGANNVTPLNDYFHGEGPVGPDLRGLGSGIRGFFVVRGRS